VNKNQLRLSIIIPFFNVEKYIAECLDSVYDQDIPESEYEVICVNDCSPDNSRQIVLDYQNKHTNLILLEHGTNKMLGAARNTGLRAARGEYVWFVDSDDYIEKNVFAKLLEISVISNLDILQFNCQRVTDEGEKSLFQFFPVNTQIISGINYILSDVTPYWERIVTAWSKLFNREFLINNNLFFPEGVYFEDNVHTMNSLLSCKRFKYVTDCMYFYRMNDSSIMNTNYLGGIKLADKVRFEVECIAILEDWRKVDTSLSDYLIPMYTYPLINRKKALLYLPFVELVEFYKRLSTIDAQKFKTNLKPKDYSVYIYPIPFYLLAFTIMPLLRILRNMKRKMNK
jgi:glycosyltransferase involved in cell wall biosynthesis